MDLRSGRSSGVQVECSFATDDADEIEL